MQQYQVIFSILSAITLFLFGLSAFSQELRNTAGAKLQVIMDKITTNRFTAFIVGVFLTAIIQSSTAVTSLAVSLVESGLVSFAGAVSIMLGAYIGTTATAWMVSFKITGIGPFFIVLGTLISLLPWRIKIFGKALFYFGFIFFSLDLVSTSLDPLKESPYLTELLLYTTSPFYGIMIGILLTAILQSSTVVTGLAIIFVQQQLLLPQDSIPIVLGANIGTTTTALFASLSLGRTAKKAAWANTIINIIGVTLLFPFLQIFTQKVISWSPTPSLVVAIAHLSFNIILVSIFLLALTPFVKMMDYLFDKKGS